MNTTLTIDKAGRVVIPKPLRDAWAIEPGDALELESSGDQITLRRTPGSGRMRKKEGVWVFSSGTPVSASTTDEVLKQIREERDLTNLGEWK